MLGYVHTCTKIEQLMAKLLELGTDFLVSVQVDFCGFAFYSVELNEKDGCTNQRMDSI